MYLPPWRVDIVIRARVTSPVPVARLGRLVSRVLTAARAPGPASIGLVLSDDVELAALNRRAMGRTGPTDVLSFPLLPASAFPPHPGAGRPAAPPASRFVLPPRVRPHLGDVVVSVERAIDQAVSGRGGQSGDRRWAVAEELRLLVAHGTLHLCGWDHAHPVEEAAMRELEVRLLAVADGRR